MRRPYVIALLLTLCTCGGIVVAPMGCGVLVPPEVSGQDPKVTAAEIAKWQGIIAFYQNRVEVLRLIVQKPGSTAKDQKAFDEAEYYLNFAQGVLMLLQPAVPATQAAK